MTSPRVTFLHAFPEQLPISAVLDPERDLDHFITGAWVWIVRTWLLLRAAGWEVEISATIPDSGVLVVHPNEASVPLLAAARPWERPDLVIVSAVADRIRAQPADVFVLQNGRYLDRPDTCFIPHWPQPGLIPRDPARGARVETASYKGRELLLHERFRDEAWRRGLGALGVRWVAEPTDCQGPDQVGVRQDWHDYATTDVVVAVRVLLDHLWTNRPASKLVNAWAAGVPALLGPEYAYRELRRSDLDYIEVRSVEEALAAVARLKERPALYQAMVDNGLRRAAEFSTDRVRAAWERLLFEDIPAGMRAGTLPRAPRRAWDVGEDFPGWQSITYPYRLS